MTPRFRFAPSPTGTPHVGNLHTALFSWALARSMNGEFFIRIEDSHQERNTPEAVQSMLDALAWLGIDWDEGPDIGGDYGPYIQSQRSKSHMAAVEQLLDLGRAYYGDDPKHPAAPHDQPLRLQIPREGHTILHDAIRGIIRFENAKLRDPILVRSDGRHLYHLAAMVDDYEMGTTHIVRAEEWISSSPYHIQLYRALEWPEPIWVHLPLVLNSQGQKLKKRDPGGRYQITDMQAAGYLPEAVFNYLMLLGWAPDTGEEIGIPGELVRQLRLERLSPSPSIFDWDKMNWVNRQHLRRLSDEALVERTRPYLEAYYELPMSDDWLRQALRIVREEMITLGGAVDLLEWAFVDDIGYTGKGKKVIQGEAARPVLTRLIAELATIVLLDEQTARSILQALRADFQENHVWNSKEIFQTVRAALTGNADGPPVHAIMSVLGKERTLQRLGAALRGLTAAYT